MLRRIGLPKRVKIRSIGVLGMWYWVLAVMFLVRDREEFAWGNWSANELLEAENGVDEEELDSGPEIILGASWLTISVAAADDTANQAAIAIGAPRDSMSVETSADGLRIVAVKLRRGAMHQTVMEYVRNCTPYFDCPFLRRNGSMIQGYEDGKPYFCSVHRIPQYVISRWRLAAVGNGSYPRLEKSG